MSEQPTQPSAAAPQPPVPAQPDPRDATIAALKKQVADLQKAAAPAEPGAGEVAVAVQEPHSEFHFGNLHLGREFQAIPAELAAAIHNAAHEAGVRLTQKES